MIAALAIVAAVIGLVLIWAGYCHEAMCDGQCGHCGPVADRAPGPDFTSDRAREYHSSNQFGR